MIRALFLSAILCAPLATGDVPIVPGDGTGTALVVIPDGAEAITEYAAKEFAYHVGQATGKRLAVARESEAAAPARAKVYIGPTAAAAAAGIDVAALPPEAFVLRTAGKDLFIAAQDGPGDPLSAGTTESGALWGVYEFLDRALGVRWLWPGPLGTIIPRRDTLFVGDMDETLPPRYLQRNLRPSLGPKGFATADPRLAFSEGARADYARDQSIFLRRHRMGRSADTYFSQRKFGSGHAFEGWWEVYGADHPEWFQLLPDGRRGPEDPDRPHRVSMCVSNPELAEKVVALWAAERAKNPDAPLGLGVGESDGSAGCVCGPCRAWDDPPADPATLPPGLERSFEPVQAGARYARFAARVHALAAEIDPDVKVHFYAYLNYFWAPRGDVALDENIIIGFVPWFRWAGWFPRTDAEQAWIKEQWLGWQRTGVTAYYRPNWFLDGYTMPHVYMHQFVDAFQFYDRNGMAATDFDSLQGMWAAQGPNLYTLARIHVRPEAPIETILGEYYDAFGAAAETVRDYFAYWENYSTENSPRAAEAIRSRRDGMFRRYAHYAAVAHELYPLDAFPPAFALLDRAEMACNDAGDRLALQRVQFLRYGLIHARRCVKTAAVVNDPDATPAARGRALAELAQYRRNIEHLGVANMDRAGIIETDSWQNVAGFTAAWPRAE